MTNIPTPIATPPSPMDRVFERSVAEIGIPPCPAILTLFSAEMRKDEPDYHRLATLLGSDVALSAGLIKTANSPFFGLRQRVRSVNEALTVLGLNAASHAVAGIILRRSFPHVPQLERFWDASARISALSGWLVQQLGIPGITVDDASTYGLFRDCGIPVLLGRFADYRATLDKANHDAVRNFIDVEADAWPTHHAMVGCVLAQSWWLPQEVCLAIRNHHDGGLLAARGAGLPTSSRRLIATGQLAEHLVQHLLGLSLTQEWPKLGGACLQVLGLDEAQVDALSGNAGAALAAVAQL